MPRVHRRDLRLAKRLVQSGVEHLRRDAQARGRRSIVDQGHLQAAVLLVGIDVREDRASCAFAAAAPAPIAPDPASCRSEWCIGTARCFAARRCAGPGRLA